MVCYEGVDVWNAVLQDADTAHTTYTSEGMQKEGISLQTY